jgi:hypothetical protein
MTTIQNFGAQLDNLDAVKEAARRAGCVQTRGRHKGEGSIRQMLHKIGAGELRVVSAREGRAGEVHRATPVDLATARYRFWPAQESADEILAWRKRARAADVRLGRARAKRRGV